MRESLFPFLIEVQSDIDTMGTTVEISQKKEASLGDTQPLKSQYTGG